ncbi:MAG: cytochrome P450 [Candidatus Nanopelagicales bacterium]
MSTMLDHELEDRIAESINSGEYFKNPYPLFDLLRSTAPVYYSKTIGGWLLTRYAEVDQVLRDAETFSSKGRVLYLLSQLPEEVREEVQLLNHHFATGLAHSDAPEHKRLRSLLARAFTPRMVENLRPATAELARSLISNLGDEFDLIDDLLTPLPATVVGSLLGSSTEDIPDLIRWAHAINGLYEKGGHISADKALHAEKLLQEMRAFVLDLVQQRRDLAKSGELNPEADVLAGLVAAETEVGALTEAELLSTAVTLFVAGHETTTHLLGNGFAALLSNPSLWSEVKSLPEMINPVVEEMGRFDGSVPRSWRIAKSDTEIAEAKIPKGDLVLPILAAANRDPEVFAAPNEFDPRQENKKHLAFGKGVHVCLGAPLARLEGQEVLRALIELKPNLRLKYPLTQLEWRKDMALRGLIHLPVIS